MSRRSDRAMLCVLAVFLARPNHAVHGLDLIRSSRLLSGTLYPLLDRMERDGWLETGWNDSAPPRRRHYKLSYAGLIAAEEFIHGHTGGGEGGTA